MIRVCIITDDIVRDIALFPANAVVSAGRVAIADEPDWLTPDGATLLASETAQIGWIRSGGILVPPTTDPGLPPAVNLAALKTSLKAEIDAAAEYERLRYITGGAGQAMTYARKVEQARAVSVATSPKPADYPMLASSIGIDGSDLAAVAQTILAMDAAWEQIGAAIETARLTAKRTVDNAESAEDARAVVPQWPQP